MSADEDKDRRAALPEQQESASGEGPSGAAAEPVDEAADAVDELSDDEELGGEEVEMEEMDEDELEAVEAEAYGQEGEAEGAADPGRVEAVEDCAQSLFMHHTDAVYSAAMVPRASDSEPLRAILGSGDDTASLVDPVLGTLLHTLTGHTDTVVAVGASRDGSLVSTASYDNTVRVWRPSTGEEVHTLEGPTQEIEWTAWHPKGNVLAAGSTDGTAWMWLAETGECMQVFAGHEGGVTCGTFSGTGKMLLTGSADGTVRAWNPRSGLAHHVFQGHGWHQDGAEILCIATQPGSPVFATGALDGSSRLCHAGKKKILGRLDHTAADADTATAVECVDFAHTRPWLATGSLDGSIRVWDVATLKPRQTYAHDDGVVRLKWMEDSPVRGSSPPCTGPHSHSPRAYTQLLVTCSLDATVRVWDTRTAGEGTLLTGHTDSILALAVFQDGDSHFALTGSDDHTARVFPLERESANVPSGPVMPQSAGAAPAEGAEEAAASKEE